MKNNLPKEDIAISIALIFSIATFFLFGLFHLGKFETTDEHLWKYGRIKQYWTSLADRDWEKTYINDKPGVTVALVTGIGLFFEPSPEANQILPVDDSIKKGLFEKYDYRQTELTNFRFRLPVLVFSTLSLLLFFWLAFKAFSSKWTALFATMLLALNPIVLGMSQIINPDSFFWIFGGLSALAYLALLNNKERKFLILCGILTGFALLSKYTAFTLFLFYAISLFAKLVFQKSEQAKNIDWKELLSRCADLAIIFLISIAVFSLFLPAVFVKPEYLFKGIGQFFNWKSIAIMIIGTFSFTIVAIYAKNFFGSVFAFLAKHKYALITTICGIFFLLLAVSFINVWTGQHLAPVDALRDAAYANEPKEFNFRPIIAKGDNSISKDAELFLMEAYPFIFSLSPLLIFAIIFISILAFKKKLPDSYSAPVFSILLFSLFYFASTLFARIVTNVRYSIILYPLMAIIGAIFIMELGKNIKLKEKTYHIMVAIIIFTTGTITLWSLRPFYFSYTNFLLPQEYTIHDSWGHGSYEAAQYLNSMPDAEKLVIWSNSDTVCRFFKGKCLRSRRIDLAIATPDYFVISKRGALKIRNRFIFTNNPAPERDSDYYFDNLEKLSVWELLIDNRPDNFVRVVKYQK